MNAKKTELTFNIFLSFIPSVGVVSGITVDDKGCNIEMSVCNSDVLLCWQWSFIRIYHFLSVFFFTSFSEIPSSSPT